MDPLTPAGVRALIGPEPEGDPAGMRALAAGIRGVARTLDTRTDIRLQHWESDEGTKVKAKLTGAARRADDAVRALRRAADLLDHEADATAAARTHWATRYSELINRDSAIPRTKI